jgi:4-amino-4-deoxy-L-arabinose transferase-like glycosyltransferase
MTAMDAVGSDAAAAGDLAARQLAGRRRAAWLALSLAVLAGLAVWLRLVALDSDAYSRLSWSSALLTDEAFYIHNARNLLLFGVARTDGFNNMLIMPTLHAVQVVVFRLFGVGAVQARMISVWSSLLTLPIFYAALRRIFGAKVAAISTIFLGLDHINLLYSRLALMDTPASALLICCLYALVRGLPAASCAAEVSSLVNCRRRNGELMWLFGCGSVLGLTYATRGLTALAIPWFLLAAWVGPRASGRAERRGHVVALLCGLGVAVVVYIIVWYAPNSAELARVNHYYVVDLLLPRSLPRLALNLARGLFDYHRGTMPYLMRNSPVQFGFACAGLGWMLVTRGGKTFRGSVLNVTEVDQTARAVLLLVAGWMAVYCLFLCAVSYAPSRYYVLFYPAMAALAAFSLVEAPRVLGEIVERKWAMALLAGFLVCLSGQALRSRIVLIDVSGMVALFWALTFAFLVGSKLDRGRRPTLRHRYAGGERPPEIWVTGLILWAVVNGYWTSDWLLHLSYRQQLADRWLAQTLPANSTVIGAVAPGLCMNNRLRAVPVIAGLCNDGKVVEACAPPRYIVILDGTSWREKWWDASYPDLVAPSRRIHTFHNILRTFFEISVFEVDRAGRRSASPLLLKR